MALVAAAPAASAAEYVVIRNAANSTPSATPQQVKAILLGETQVWGSGTVVQVVLPETDSPALAGLATDLLGMQEAELRKRIRAAVFKGEMRRPLGCANDAACLDLVKANRGAFAVMSLAAAAHLPDGVAAVHVKR